MPTTTLTRVVIFSIITAVTLCIYLILVVSIDNSNLGTANGLWKSVPVSSWEHSGSGPADSGGFLYLLVYGHLSRFIPDHLVQYGIAVSDPTFRKLAVLNTFFGALACGFIWLLALRLTGLWWAAALIAAMHAGTAFVLLNSINSEDIIPAYAFLLAATVAFFEFLDTRNAWLLIGSALSFAFATLFHWTVMIPALAGFAATLIYLALKRRTYLIVGAMWVLVWLGAAKLLVFLTLPNLHVSVGEILFPAKAEGAAGWTGLRLEKLLYLIVGIGNYFSGGGNFTNYHDAFRGSYVFSFVLSWCYVLIGVAGCLVTLFRAQASSFLKSSAVFAVVLFVVGEAENVYSQPQDPQMQLAPMLASVMGISLLTAYVSSYFPGLKPRLVAFLFGVIVLANSVWNVHLMRLHSGEDTRSIVAVQKLNELFPRERTLIVDQGFEPWVAWHFVLLGPHIWPEFLDHNFQLSGPFITYKGISANSAATLVRQRIDAALARKKKVVAFALWSQQPDAFIASMLAVSDTTQARNFDSILRHAYRLGKRWETPIGSATEILPENPSSKQVIRRH